ncbi:phage tail protein, partial [Microbacteriaceae bacterium K1510]|nr:phage tail protein [Microbacteriaceae bacterium K1510]
MGEKGETFSIRGVIFDPEFGGQASLDGLRAAAKRGELLMLVTRAGKVHGRHRIENISEDRDYIHASGVARKNAYVIDLKLYQG